MIKIEKILKKYGERTVLNISSLEFIKGEVSVIVGPNGSGKSTLLKILAGVIKADESLFTTDKKLLYLPQQSVPFGKPVERNIYFAMENGDNKEERCHEILASLGLIHLKNKNAKTLSGGECQRLALSRVLVNDCDFLLLDEPSSAADIEGNELIEKAIADYKEKTGCGIIMTTHSPLQAKTMGDRIIMLHGGEIAEDGSPKEIFENPVSDWSEKFISQWRI